MCSKFSVEKIVLYLIFFLLTIGIVFFLFFIKGNKQVDKKTEQLFFENISNKKEVGRLNEIEEKDKNIYYKINYPSIGKESIDVLVKDKVDELKKSVQDKYENSSMEVTTCYFLDYETYMGVGDTFSLILKETIEFSNLEVINHSYVYIFSLDQGIILNVEDIFEDGYQDVLNKYLDGGSDFSFYIKGSTIVLLFNRQEIALEELSDYFKLDKEFVKSYQVEQEEIEYTIVNKEYVVNENVVLFKEGKLDSEVIGDLKKDEVVKVLMHYANGWSVLLYHDGLAFVESKKIMEKGENNFSASNENISDGSSGNVVSSEEKVDYSKVKKEVLYTLVDLNLRNEADVKSTLLGEIKKGEKVERIEKLANGWSKIIYKEKVGFVSSSYLVKTLAKEKVGKGNVSSQGNINSSKPMVALTFDDGPSGSATPRILNVLEKYNVHATFFDLGNLMLKYPNIVKRESQIGEVGTHTYSHKNLNKLSEKELVREIQLSKEAYRKVLGHDPYLLRPPYGSANNKVKANVDIPLIHWNVDTLDWKYRNKNLILNEIDKYGNLDGKIILMHSIYETTADAVEVLVPNLLSKGYQIVSVSELAKAKGVNLTTGKVYYGFN